MPYQHSNVYIVRVNGHRQPGRNPLVVRRPVRQHPPTRPPTNWSLWRSILRRAVDSPTRCAIVKALFSDDDCLRVQDYGRAEHGSLY